MKRLVMGIVIVAFLVTFGPLAGTASAGYGEQLKNLERILKQMTGQSTRAACSLFRADISRPFQNVI